MSKKGIPSSTPGKFEDQDTILYIDLGDNCYSIGDNAFKDCSLLIKIDSDNVIESIGSHAFANTKITTATFNNLNTLGYGAFNCCINLEHINIPNYIDIPNFAFQGCESLKEIDLTNVSVIYGEAFDGCKSLTSINIPNCNTIEPKAFRNCYNLKKVNNSVNTNTIIFDSAFENCLNLIDFNFKNCYSIGQGAFAGCEKLDEINLDTCTSIGKYAFDSCSNITQVTLSNCRKIGEYAFSNCPKLDRVYIYNSGEICQLESTNAFCECEDSDPTQLGCTIKFYFKADEYHNYINHPQWEHFSKNMIMMVNNNQIIYTTANRELVKVNDDIGNLISNNQYFNKSNYGVLEFKDIIESLNYHIFKDNTFLTSIDIPSECKSIGESEFENCTNLTNVTPSKVLESIGDYAFKNCTSLSSFTIPESITDLGEGILAGCENIKKIKGKFVTYDEKAIVYNGKLIYVLPVDDTITEGRIYNISDIDLGIHTLGKSCFHGCKNMRRVDIPSYIQFINDNAFENCTNLCEIHFEGNTPPILGNDIFKYVRDDFKIFVPEDQLSVYNESWSIYSDHIYPIAKGDSIIYYGDQLDNITNQTFVNLDSNYKNGKYYKISNVGTTIPEGFFGSFSDSATNQSTKKVILGEGIRKISKGVFKNFAEMEYIYIPDSIKELGDECFYRCYKLKRIHIPSGIHSVFKENTSYDKSTSTTKSSNANGQKIHLQELSLISLSSVTFGHSIFDGCRSLSEFGSYYKGCVSEDNRCYIDKNSSLLFFADGGITEYTIPDYITEINRTAFKGTHLTTITLNESIKTIGESAFSGCQQLKTIENWDNVETISENAFWCCFGLSGISLPKNLKTIGKNAFAYCKNMYINTNIPDSVTEINDYAFYQCEKFKYSKNTLNLNNITILNNSVFEGCKALSKVQIGDKVETIGYKAFANCISLKSVYISKNSNLTKINEYAFNTCIILTELNLPDKLTYIGYLAFENCFNYKGNYIETMQQYILIIPSKVTTIGHSCFRKSGIEKLIILPDSKLTNIPDYAFYECEQLKSTKMLDGSKVVNIGYQAFAGCRQLYNLELPNLLNSIGDGAFAGCCNLLIATLPENLQFMGDCCFTTNTSATDIYIPSSLTKPPLFTKNGKVDSTSNPFGNILLTPKNVPTIIIHSSIVNTYRRTPHWIKYNGKITVKSDTVNYYTNLTYVNAGCPENVEYSISVNDLNIASVNSSSSRGKIIEQRYGEKIANIEVVVTSNTSGEERLLRVRWNGENGTIIYTPEDGIVQIPNESHEKNVSILLKRNVNVNCRGQLIIEIL